MEKKKKYKGCPYFKANNCRFCRFTPYPEGVDGGCFYNHIGRLNEILDRMYREDTEKKQ